LASIAIFSDVHADLSALRSVLADIDERGIEHIWCLGDFCSGGPEPAECFDLTMERCEIVLAGNHEHFVRAHVWEGWSAWWAEAAKLAHTELGHDRVSRLGRMKSGVRSGASEADGGPTVTLVHGALTNPRDSFITQPKDAKTNFDLLQTTLLFYGHTHVPKSWSEPDVGVFATPGTQRALTAGRHLVNPGAGCDGQGARWLEWDVAENEVTWHATRTRGHAGKWRP
jgi:predicted phosphodiesterase